MGGNRVGRSRRRLLRSVSVIVLTLIVSALNVPAAEAQVLQIDIPIDSDIHVEDFSTVVITTVDVPPEAIGAECTATSFGVNQESTREGNDILIDSGSSQVVIPNVEALENSVVAGQGTLTLGTEIVVSMTLESGRFSGGLLVTIECELATPQPGRIIVVKEATDGSDTTQSFNFSSSYSDEFALADGQQNDSGDLVPGTYSVAESVPAGWNLVSATCDDQSPVDAIDLSEGETVTCTFLNEQVQDVVGASIVVTVSASCQLEGDDGVGRIAVGVSVDDGATVVIRDSAGEVVETLTSDGSITVAAGAAYMWEATASDGFQFPPGFVASGSIDIEDCTPTPPAPTPDEVMASILVTVDSFCEDADGFVDIDLSVAGGATVVVSDSDGDVMGTLTADGTITVPEGATYTWVATPSEGFEFPPGFAASGTITIENCSDPETLPFTGLDLDVAAAFAAAFLGAGITVLVSQWRREEQ